MTREEYDIKIQDKKYSLQQQKDRFVAYYHIGKSYIKSLEQRIAELSAPKTCEGCRYYHPETYLEHKYCACNNKCSLWNYSNFYEPKEQK